MDPQSNITGVDVAVLQGSCLMELKNLLKNESRGQKGEAK